jgi:HEAT repeat protein
LVQRSILGALVEMDSPEELFEVCAKGIGGEDLTVQESSVDALGSLANTSQHAIALSHLLDLTAAPADRIRWRVAYALKHFNDTSAREALTRLRQDESHRVVGTALEDLLPE